MKVFVLMIISSYLGMASSAMAGVFIAPFGGYSVGGNGIQLDLYDGSGKQQDSAHWGTQLGLTHIDGGDVYLFYSRQHSDFSSHDSASLQNIAALTVEYMHLAGNLYFTDGSLRPYVSASAGITRLDANDTFDATTDFSMSVGLGVNWQLYPKLWLFAEIRGVGTYLGDKSYSSDCSRYSDCYHDDDNWYASDDLWQGQANLGLQFRF